MPEDTPTRPDRLLRAINPVVMILSILATGFSFPLQLTKLWFPFRLLMTLVGMVVLFKITAVSYDRSGAVFAIIAFGATNALLAACWWLFVFVLGILMIFDINRRA